MENILNQKYTEVIQRMNKYFFILCVFFVLINCNSKKIVKDDNSATDKQSEQNITEKKIDMNSSENMSKTTRQSNIGMQDSNQPEIEKSITSTAKVMVDSRQKEKTKKDSQRFFPASIGNKWFYQGYWKNDKDKKIVKVRAEILNTEKRDDKEYFYYYAPKVGIRYLNRKDENGVYMRVIKFPFPIFSFALIEVDIEPEILVIKFPLKVGEKWTQKAKASTTLFGIWKISRDIQSDFEVVEKVKIKTGIGEVEAYHIKANIDNSYEKTVENYWYGKDIGYSVSDTSSYFVQIYGYILKDESTGEIKKITPQEGEKEYD